MRKELYLSICCALLRPDEETGAPSVFKHVDLWNRNVEFIDVDESL
jgi:hypothetical protein